MTSEEAKIILKESSANVQKILIEGQNFFPEYESFGNSMETELKTIQDILQHVITTLDGDIE